MHTELVGKLPGPIEFFMNTPSHHRVHHARNYGRKCAACRAASACSVFVHPSPALWTLPLRLRQRSSWRSARPARPPAACSPIFYLDSSPRNFGDVLIIWDRLFGTFQPERADRKPVYGLNALVRPCATVTLFLLHGSSGGCHKHRKAADSAPLALAAAAAPPPARAPPPPPPVAHAAPLAAARPALQPMTEGTYNPFWHQVHHLVATLKLAASGTVGGQSTGLARHTARARPSSAVLAA